MAGSGKFDFDLNNLPVDVFDLSESGLKFESLTDGHGMPEVGASCIFNLCICSTAEN